MIVRVVLICLLEIDRSDYIHKVVSFAHKRKKTRKLNNAVLIDANSLTQNMSLTIGVFSFCVKLFRCRSPAKFKFKQKKLEWRKERWQKALKEENVRTTLIH